MRGKRPRPQPPTAAANVVANATTEGAADDEAAILLKALLPESGNDARERALGKLAQSKDKRFNARLLDLLRFVKTREEYAR